MSPLSKRRRVVACAIVALVSAALCVWACVESAFSEGQFSCDPGGKAECPPGLLCADDGRCRSLQVILDDAGTDAPIVGEDVVDAASPVDACSIATWTVLAANRGPAALAVGADGRLFLGGTAGDGGWLAELDPCDGGTIRERVFETPTGPLPSVQDILVTNDELVVSGVTNDTRTGLFARFAKETFATKEERAFDGGGGFVGFDSIARTDDGAYVLGGAKDIFAPTMAGWVARVDGTTVCTATSGNGIAGVFPAGGDKAAIFGGVSDNSRIEFRTVGEGCALGAIQSAPFPASAQGGPSSMTGSLATPIVVGAYGPALDAGGRDWGLVASITGTTLTIAPPFDPNAGRVDIIQRGVVDGDQLYLAALQSATLTGGTPTLLRYTLPLTATSKPTLTTGIFGGELVAFRGMKTNPSSMVGDDALFIAGPKPGSRSSGAITRCRKSVGCR